MYPTADIELDPSLPAGAEYWEPDPGEIDEYEGFGLFLDVWAITDVSVEDAIAVAREDGLLCQVVGGLAGTQPISTSLLRPSRRGAQARTMRYLPRVCRS